MGRARIGPGKGNIGGWTGEAQHGQLARQSKFPDADLLLIGETLDRQCGDRAKQCLQCERCEGENADKHVPRMAKVITAKDCEVKDDSNENDCQRAEQMQQSLWQAKCSPSGLILQHDADRHFKREGRSEQHCQQAELNTSVGGIAENRVKHMENGEPRDDGYDRRGPVLGHRGKYGTHSKQHDTNEQQRRGEIEPLLFRLCNTQQDE